MSLYAMIKVEITETKAETQKIEKEVEEKNENQHHG
jgi:hypothetical protein